MFTYFIYNLIAVVAVTAAYLAEHCDKKDVRTLCRIVVFLALWLPAALRYDTGSDYSGYYHGFYSILRGADSRFEYGWVLLNRLTIFLGLPVQWIFVFSSVLVYAPICFVMKRKHYFYVILFYILFGFYFKSYDIVRQCIAASCIMCAFVCLEDKKYFTFFLLFVLAFLFHKSALLVFPFCFLAVFKQYHKAVPILVTIVGLFIIARLNMMIVLTDLLNLVNSDYARYGRSGFYTSKTPLNSGIGVFVRMLPSFLTIILATKINREHKEKTLLVNLSIIYIFSCVLSVQFVILGRIRDIFLFVPVMLAGYTIAAAKKYKLITAIVLISLNIILFEKSIRNEQPGDRFRNDINPYQSVFSLNKTRL